MKDISIGTFGAAIGSLKQGKKVCRRGWNGKNMFLVLIGALNYNVDNSHVKDFLGQAFIGMKTAQDMFVPWLASQSDMLAEDWEEVE